MEITQAVPTERADDDRECVDAEFVENTEVQQSLVRRAPQGVSQAATVSPRVSMDLDRWLEVDRQLHELYQLVEIAIMQRDDAMKATSVAETVREITASRLREWKTYARSLEERLHASQIDNLEMSFALKRTTEVAEEALSAPRFGRARKNDLRNRLAQIGDELV